jgi:Ca2+-transporting ATPase
MEKPSLPTELNWHAEPADLALESLGTSPDGLSQAEAERRLTTYGPNVLKKSSKDGPLQVLWRQINNPLIWVLIGAGLLAILMGKATDGLVVLAVVVVNTIIGFYQEYKAGKAIEALADMVPENVNAIRDGRKLTIPAADLVPGDVVSLASGDKVPADMRLFAVRNLQVEEAALTGESVPVEKNTLEVGVQSALGDRKGMAFGGTLVTYGTATGVIVKTGQNTELGRISTMLQEATDLETPLTKALHSIAKIITIGIMIVAVVMIIVAVARGAAASVETGQALQEAIIFAIALAVGAIPEGLPAIVTIALAIGVRRMASRRAIIRRLPAVETLGSTTTICSDKTGTLTRNEMTVQALWTPIGKDYEVTGVGYEPVGELRKSGEKLAPTQDALHLAEMAALCNDASLTKEGNAWKMTGDPTEGALLTASEKLGGSVDKLHKDFKRIDAIPFESENQFMATLNEDQNGDPLILMKGAPEVVLNRTTDTHREEVIAEIERLAGKGMRVLGVAQKRASAGTTRIEMEDVKEGFQFLGLVGMIDPPRPEAIEAIRACHNAGITVKMITGDHKGTAQAIGQQLGILNQDQPAIIGTALAEMNDSEMQKAVSSTNVFARVAPEHKLRLVKALQAKDHVVAMTGDGVNDAPALKQSNIGVAMGITGTSVTKESADIVLTDDNFASIAAAVEEGRRVYDNLIKSLAFLLPTNLGLAFILMYAVAFNPYLPSGELLMPMLPTQLLWINLVASVALGLPLAFEAMEPNVMKRPPRDPNEPVLSKFVIFRTVMVALLMTIGAVGLFTYEYQASLQAGFESAKAISKAQTMAVTTVIMFQIFYMLNCRSLKDSIAKIGFFSNPTVFMGIGALILLQLAFIFLGPLQQVFSTAALDLRDIGLSVLVGTLILPVISVEKWIRGRMEKS